MREITFPTQELDAPSSKKADYISAGYIPIPADWISNHVLTHSCPASDAETEQQAARVYGLAPTVIKPGVVMPSAVNGA
eukprot:CAMPEP_0203941372 /NCGR_PEP_ID=MMETSP0359-20131031/77764_1 /ASSEMBLY_ACC=CAM_ASM_000338 /TAXON_ID=268821 /ORGANISM="Scrippsiella Hangoei, Strain SHTV-5" /LENGTH=78 /DNA_ID=CAMNT_0050871921 /DNA_START=19 /DNA_END=253 /DNA_ORIENTATION=+